MTGQHSEGARDAGEQFLEASERSLAELIRKLRRWLVVAVTISIVVAVLGVGLSYAIQSLRDAQEQTDALLQANTATIDELRKTNEELAAQGKDTVPVPNTPSNPESVDPDAIAALAAAKVLAQIPTPRDGRTPTSAELAPLVATAVASYLAANPPPPGEDGQTPSVEQITTVTAAVVAAYFAANPPPAGVQGEPGEQGPQGEPGTPGPPPTAEEIQAAVNAWIAANPPPYCPAGYSATPASVLTLDGPREGIFCFLDSPTPLED